MFADLRQFLVHEQENLLGSQDSLGILRSWIRKLMSPRRNATVEYACTVSSGRGWRSHNYQQGYCSWRAVVVSPSSLHESSLEWVLSEKLVPMQLSEDRAQS